MVAPNALIAYNADVEGELVVEKIKDIYGVESWLQCNDRLSWEFVKIKAGVNDSVEEIRGAL